MTPIRRALALATYAAFIPFSLTGLGGAREMHSAASMNMGAQSTASPDMENGQMASSATTTRTDARDCVPPPCDDRMPPDGCPAAPGCVPGALVVQATLKTAAVGPATAGLAAALVTHLRSRAIAPEVPPPRAY